MPLIVAGPDVPAGRVVATPVSHIDCAPTILEGAGLPPRVGGRALPGASLFALASGAMPQRPVISEYHATGSVAGAYMLRFGQWKYCHYVGARPQLFDLDADPEELTDVADDPRYAATLVRRRAAAARRARSGSDRRAREAAAGGTARRNSAGARRRWRAATWASRPRPAPRPRSTSALTLVLAAPARREPCLRFRRRRRRLRRRARIRLGRCCTSGSGGAPARHIPHRPPRHRGTRGSRQARSQDRAPAAWGPRRRRLVDGCFPANWCVTPTVCDWPRPCINALKNAELDGGSAPDLV